MNEIEQLKDNEKQNKLNNEKIINNLNQKLKET